MFCFSVQIGERSKPGLGGAVTSFINGVGQVGGVVEGPIIGILAASLGWQGVLISLVIVSALGTIAVYRAALIDQGQRNNQSLLIT